MDDKVYTNQEIADTPFPNQPDNTTVTDSTPSSSNTKAAGQTTIPQQSFIQKNIAVETESQAFNTRTKKIIQEFQFTPSGAIQIGDFKSGITGDVRMSPEGIAARNKLGDTTFALDGDTGDAIFKGEVRAEDFVVVDEFGLISLASFHSANKSAFYYRSTNQADPQQVPDTTLSFTLKRTTNVLVLLSFLYYMQPISSGISPEANVYLGLDGSPYQTAIFVVDTMQGADAAAFYTNFSREYSGSYQVVLTLPPGQHTIDMWFQIDSAAGASIYVGNTSVTYIILGN